MAKPGRKPVPVALKIASGMRKDRIPSGALEAPQGAPTAPEWLDAFGVEGFNRLAAAAGRLGLASPVDADQIAIFAVAYSRWRNATAAVEADGLMIEGAHGGKIASPAVGIAERAEKTMSAVLATFGLNPSDRSRLKATEQSEDEFDRFIRETAK
jgi:P27 family predicted phage terminase small subunit